jgi:hypothetical protein
MQSNRAISSMINTSRVEKPSGLNVPALKCRSMRFSNAYNSDRPADFTFSSKCMNVSFSSWICFVMVSLVGFKCPLKGFGLMARVVRRLTPQSPASVKCGAVGSRWFLRFLRFLRLSRSIIGELLAARQLPLGFQPEPRTDRAECWLGGCTLSSKQE